jgi:hypothetical protein
MYVFQFRVSIDEIVWVVGGAKLLPVRLLFGNVRFERVLISHVGCLGREGW